MITIFAIPKPFNRKFSYIQHNAILSWKKITDDIIVFGDEKGVASEIQQLNIRHVAKISCNKHKTPIMSDAFSKIKKIARYSTVAYVNSDVILPSDFSDVIQCVTFSQYLIVGKRHNIDIKKKISFKGSWEDALKNTLKKQGKVNVIGNSSEFFVFPKTLQFNMPDFAVGRLYWDSWLIYKARCMKIPVIDATPSIFYFHQIHDYSHHPHGFKGVWYGSEAKKNFKLSGGSNTRFKVTDADWVVTSKGLEKPRFTARRLVRSIRIKGIIDPHLNIICFPTYIVTIIIFKTSMLIQVLYRRGFASIIDTLKHPELLDYKFKEL